jgi:hypothetical protein
MGSSGPYASVPTAHSGWQGKPDRMRNRQRWLSAGLFLVALATLLLELLDSRLLSVLTWYHLSFFAVSLAMLGMAAGAITVFLAGDRFEGDGLKRRLPRWSMGLALSIPATHVLSLYIPLPDLAAVEFNVMLADIGWLTAATVVMTIPFFLAGIVITAGLTRAGGQIGHLYAADLLGASAGALLIVPLLELTDISTAAFAAGAAASGGALCFMRALEQPWRPGALAIMAALGVATIVNATVDDGIGVVYAKGRRIDTPLLQRTVWNSHSFITIGHPIANQAPWYWGRGERADDTRVTWASMQIDGAAATPITKWDGDPKSLGWVGQGVTSLPYRLRQGDAAIIGVGGGRDILAAIGHGSTTVTGVEINRTFVDVLHGSHRKFANLADYEGVELVHAEARSWLTRATAQYDVLQMSLIDTFAATGAGAFTLTENGLYTVEAWRVFLDRLKPRGVFSVSRFFSPANVSETTRLISLGVATLVDRGIERPWEHVILVARGVVATLLLSVDPFDAEDIRRIDSAAEEYGFDVILGPNRRPEDSQLDDIVRSPNAERLSAAAAHPDYDYQPPTDGRPYFFNILKLSSLAKVRDASLGVVAGNVRATATLVILFAIAAVLVAAIIFVPLMISGLPQMGAVGFASAIAYFASLGAGFMLIEIPLLQSFSVYLGHPAYTYAVILFSMIFFTGIGSGLSDRVDLDGSAWRILAPLTVSGLALAFAFGLPFIVDATVAMATPARCAIAVALVAPLATVLGFCFPLGLRAVERIAPEATAWMWGINGACGVLASIAAVAMSISLGIRANLFSAALLYLFIVFPAAKLVALGRSR